LRLIVGLGNPGRKYENTRHNVGFRAIDYLAREIGTKVEKEKYKALLGEGLVRGEKVILVKPQTFMNLSGEAVAPLAAWYKVNPSEILVLYDDLALEVGKLRIRVKGSHGGHNGMRSLIAHLKTESIPRIRLGIGQAPPEWDVADYVLGSFSSLENKQIEESIIQTGKAVEMILTQGLEKAMSKFN